MYSALYDENATQEERVVCFQKLINSGQAWLLEGSVGRAAMRLIEDGACILGEEGHQDYWGNYVPARSEVQEGTKGSRQYAVERRGEQHVKMLEAA